jgi:hypothetical protein
MGGTSSNTQQSSNQSQLTPWGSASPGLQGILGNLQPSINSMNGTPLTNQAFGQLEQNAQQPNPLGGAAMGAAQSQLGGGANYGGATNTVNSGYDASRAALSPYTSGNATDPSSNPALAQQLATVNTQVGNAVNPMFSAAGRLGSPMNAQAMGQGIALGDTGILQNAAQNQIQAGGILGNLSNNAGSVLGNLDTSNAGVQSQGINNASTAYGAQNLGPQQLLSAALMQQQLPMQNASQLTGIFGPLAAQFGQQTGSGSQTGTQTMSPWQMMTSGVNAFANLNKSFSGGGGGGGGGYS